MSDSLLSFTIIFAEIGGFLLVAAIAWGIYFLLKSQKEGRKTKELIKYIKELLPAHKEKLTNYFTDELELNDGKVELNVETLMKDEKKIYDHLIQFSINKDTSLLKLTTDDINSLINDYVRLLALKEEKETDESKESRDLLLKKENEALRLEKASLESRLSTATETIESMMGEFSSMYEGGKKEGEQRVKNEMYKLKQNLDEEEARMKSEVNELSIDESEKDDG